MEKKINPSYDPLYSKWSGIKTRCYNPKDKGYKRYGGRGIKMCDEWLNDFYAFKKWLLDSGYKKGLTVDRHPDNSGDYSPTNCRLATPKQQGNNRRTNMLLELNGETKTLSEWADQYKQRPKLIHNRLRHGWDLLTSLTTIGFRYGYTKRTRNEKGQFI